MGIPQTPYLFRGQERYKGTAEVEERINFLNCLLLKHWALRYFNVADFIKKAGKVKAFLLYYGRGSAAGSIVAYCAEITNIDPIKYRLLFRF